MPPGVILERRFENMSEGKHAPTPWEAVYLGKTTWAVRSKGGLRTLVIFRTIDAVWNENHAKFIVQSCNSHDQKTIDALVDVCEKGLGSLMRLMLRLDTSDEDDTIRLIQAALTLVKREP